MSEIVMKPTCGIVMPISALDGCTESHWADVQDILTDAIESAGFNGNLVSNADDVGIIHKRIIQNLYDNPIVVCDVSGKNPNVMFELGMRLAFDKPTVIVKDDKTSYSFDTSAIEHLEYPRDLRFSRIMEFKQKLSEKIAATHKRATSDKDYTTFLKHFGEFTVAKLEKKEVSSQEFILEELRSVRSAMRRLEFSARAGRDRSLSREVNVGEPDIDICLQKATKAQAAEALETAKAHPSVTSAGIHERGPDHLHLYVDVKPGTSIDQVRFEIAPKARLRRLMPKDILDPENRKP
jgi:hypothetical protein